VKLKISFRYSCNFRTIDLKDTPVTTESDEGLLKVVENKSAPAKKKTTKKKTPTKKVIKIW